MDVQFEWDEAKALANLLNHGVSFEEAKTVFGDLYALTIFDGEHSLAEDRFITIGFSTSGRLLIVVYTERGTRIRLISSRKATSREQRDYEQRAN